MTLITGNTFPVKEAIKTLGGKWDPMSRGWKVPDEKAEEAKALVAKGTSTTRPKPHTPSRCEECGCAPSRYVKIYRNGVCSNCYRAEREEAEMGY